MANSVNKQILLGNVGNDPRIGEFGERKVAEFTVATGRKYKDAQGQLTERTEWHNIICWTPLAEIAEQYVKKGSRVYIEGETRHRKYQTREGEERTITEVVASQLVLCGDRGERSDGARSSAPSGGEYFRQSEAPQPAERPLVRQSASSIRQTAPVASGLFKSAAPATAPAKESKNDFGEALGIGTEGVTDDLPF